MGVVMAYKDPEKQKAAQRRYEERRRKNKRKSIWWGYLYPESAEEGWLKRLKESGLEYFAIIHDKDVTATGEIKKTHVHIAVRFAHAVDRSEAVMVLGAIGVLDASVQYRDNWRAVARYMCHLDDPDKYQYDTSDVLQGGGADYYTAIHRGSDKYRVIADMQDYVDDNNICSFKRFMDYCRHNEPTWFMALCDNSAIIMREYIKSNRYDNIDNLNGVDIN